jgi:hypothetical protein
MNSEGSNYFCFTTELLSLICIITQEFTWMAAPYFREPVHGSTLR